MAQEKPFRWVSVSEKDVDLKPKPRKDIRAECAAGIRTISQTSRVVRTS